MEVLDVKNVPHQPEYSYKGVAQNVDYEIFGGKMDYLI